MKKFRFKLQTLQKVRLLKEEKALIEFEKAQRLVAEAQKAVNAILDKLQAMENDLKQIKHLPFSAVDLAQYSQYSLSLHQLLEQAQDHLMRAQNKAAEKRRDLEKAIKERKVLDKLKEKQLADWQKLNDDLEKAFIDEMAVLRFKSNHSPSSS